MTLVSSLKSVGLISETVTIIKRTEELKCFIWHWIITYVRNNDVRDTCFKKSSLTGPLFFFSLSASCRSFSSILENLRECRSQKNSESLRKTSYQVELLKNGKQADWWWETSTNLSLSPVLYHSNTGNSCQRVVQTFWVIKCKTFSSHILTWSTWTCQSLKEDSIENS